MKLNPPKVATVWASILLAVVGFVIYALEYMEVIKAPIFGLIGVLVLLVGFILLILALNIKGL